MANINNTFRKFLRQRFYHHYVLGKRSEPFLAAWSSACVPRVWSHSNDDRCPRMDTNMPGSLADFVRYKRHCTVEHQGHWLIKIAYQSLLARARVTSIITCAYIYLVKEKLIARTKARIKHIDVINSSYGFLTVTLLTIVNAKKIFSLKCLKIFSIFKTRIIVYIWRHDVIFEIWIVQMETYT